MQRDRWIVLQQLDQELIFLCSRHLLDRQCWIETLFDIGRRNALQAIHAADGMIEAPHLLGILNRLSLMIFILSVSKVPLPA